MVLASPVFALKFSFPEAVSVVDSPVIRYLAALVGEALMSRFPLGLH